MPPKIEMIGKRFGRLTVVSEDGRNKYGSCIWRCVCDCGIKVTVIGESLRGGHTQSCGCLQREIMGSVNKKHGLKGEKIYWVYRAMIKRCTDKKDKGYKYYGGRGINVCDEWKDNIENFISDMGLPKKDMSLERIDNDGDYCKENCMWASQTVQARNRRSTILTQEKAKEIREKRKLGTTYRELSVEYGVSVGAISGVVRNRTWRQPNEPN